MLKSKWILLEKLCLHQTKRSVHLDKNESNSPSTVKSLNFKQKSQNQSKKMLLLKITFASLVLGSILIRLIKFIMAAKFLSTFPEAEYTAEPLGKQPNRLLWIKRLIFGHLIDFGQGSGNYRDFLMTYWLEARV